MVAPNSSHSRSAYSSSCSSSVAGDVVAEPPADLGRERELAVREGARAAPPGHDVAGRQPTHARPARGAAAPGDAVALLEHQHVGDARPREFERREDAGGTGADDDYLEMRGKTLWGLLAMAPVRFGACASGLLSRRLSYPRCQVASPSGPRCSVEGAGCRQAVTKHAQRSRVHEAALSLVQGRQGYSRARLAYREVDVSRTDGRREMAS